MIEHTLTILKYISIISGYGTVICAPCIEYLVRNEKKLGKFIIILMLVLFVIYLIASACTITILKSMT